ncbi:hypothetical protein HRI_000963800 [Hibiscus trionum]|uniref:beta-ketoacyl-[acyl-carrier-protein] synthase I n=1 Tax=Hibiscus trionum TaxID=183268 RepID=A0A9W7H8L8_HIBTR|nr:hypothetical protein HRI_000963800 [Hibiscus trionum]
MFLLPSATRTPRNRLLLRVRSWFSFLGIELGFMGPNYSISTACATSNYCLYVAANHIRQGEAGLMIAGAGGTEAPIIPIGLGGFGAPVGHCLKETMILKLRQGHETKIEMAL